MSVQVKKSSKQKEDSPDYNKSNDPDPILYREVNLSDLPSQYTEDIETFGQILKLPDPRDIIPIFSWHLGSQ